MRQKLFVVTGATSSASFRPSWMRRCAGSERGVAGECELRGQELVGRSLPRRPGIWAAEHRSPTGPRIRAGCFGKAQSASHG